MAHVQPVRVGYVDINGNWVALNKYGDTFNIPELKENDMQSGIVPQSTGDLLDLLTTIGTEGPEGKRLHDIIHKRLSKRLRTDGLKLALGGAGEYIIVADPEREVE